MKTRRIDRYRSSTYPSVPTEERVSKPVASKELGKHQKRLDHEPLLGHKRISTLLYLHLPNVRLLLVLNSYVR